MKTRKTKFKKILVGVLAVVLSVAYLPMMEMTVKAATEPTELIQAIEAVGGLTATWDGTSTVTVTGSNDAVTQCINLRIPQDVTVDWQASIKGEITSPNPGENALLLVQNPLGGPMGSFKMSGDARIEARTTAEFQGAISINVDFSYSAATNGKVTINENVEIIVDDGFNSKGAALRVTNCDAEITGAKVRSTNGCAIYGNATNMTITNSEITGSIVSYYATVLVTGGVVVNEKGPALETRDSGTIEVIGDAVLFGKPATNITSSGSTITVNDTVIAISKSNDEATYIVGSDTDLSVSPSKITVKWATKDGNSGVEYTDGTTTKFLELSEHTVFVPVASITGVPSNATAGDDLALSGTVAPENATNQEVTWSIKNAGTTGAEISDNKLKTSGAGTVVIVATIKNGATTSSDYQQEFTIEVAAATGESTTPEDTETSDETAKTNESPTQNTTTTKTKTVPKTGDENAVAVALWLLLVSLIGSGLGMIVVYKK